jgi:hypothetical protein
MDAVWNSANANITEAERVPIVMETTGRGKAIRRRDHPIGGQEEKKKPGRSVLEVRHNLTARKD